MITFRKLSVEDQKQVLEWRTKEDVTKYMHTDIEKNMEQQLKWFEQISKSPTDQYWIIEVKNQPVGLISLNDIDRQNRRTSWGYYIGEKKYRMYGGLIPPYLYNYVFHKLGFHKIIAEVMQENKNVIKLNKVHGCREVGVYKEHIYKNGKFHDIVLMELLKEDWLSNGKFQKYIARFE